MQVFLNQLVACGSWSLGLQAIKKFPAALQVPVRQRAVIISEPRQQIISCESHATSFVDPAGDVSVTVTSASVSIQTLAPQLRGLSGQ